MPEIQNPNLQTQGPGGSGGGGGDMRSTIVFFGLMLAVLIGYQSLFKPASSPAPRCPLRRPRHRPEHRPGALGAAWSTWSTADFHRKSTVRGEADSWVDGGRNEVLPYYAQNNYSST